MPGEAVTEKKCLKQEHSVNHMMLAPLSASRNEGVKDVVWSVLWSAQSLIYKAFENIGGAGKVCSPVPKHLAELMLFII